MKTISLEEQRDVLLAKIRERKDDHLWQFVKDNYIPNEVFIIDENNYVKEFSVFDFHINYEGIIRMYQIYLMEDVYKNDDINKVINALKKYHHLMRYAKKIAYLELKDKDGQYSCIEYSKCIEYPVCCYINRSKK